MKKQTTLKAFALSLAMAVGMLLPTTTNAQSDGFFRGGIKALKALNGVNAIRAAAFKARKAKNFNQEAAGMKIICNFAGRNQ